MCIAMARRRRISFTLRSMILFVSVTAVLLALDQTAERNARAFRKTLQKEPERLVFQENRISGEITVEVEGVLNTTTLLDRFCLRRQFTVFYSAVVEAGQNFTNIQGTDYFATSLTNTERLPRPKR